MKRNRKSGFTLVEMLCSIVVMLLVTIGVATGVQLAMRSYAKSVSNSEAQALCATLTSAVSDKLRNSGTVDATTNPITFFCPEVGKAASFSQNDQGQVMLNDQKLLPSRTYPHGMKAQVVIERFDSSSNTFDVSIQVTDSTGKKLSGNDFQVKALNAKQHNTPSTEA